MIYTYQHEERTYTVNLERQPDGTYRATIGDTVYSIQVKHGVDGSLLLTWDDGRALVHTAADDNQRYVHMNGTTYTLAVPDARAVQRKAAGAGGDLTAQMPGQVVEVLVDAGDEVEAGQALVILEAMKMEIRVTAPIAGTVAKLLVDAGDVVDRGQTLVEITPAE